MHSLTMMSIPSISAPTANYLTAFTLKVTWMTRPLALRPRHLVPAARSLKNGGAEDQEEAKKVDEVSEVKYFKDEIIGGKNKNLTLLDYEKYHYHEGKVELQRTKVGTNPVLGFTLLAMSMVIVAVHSEKFLKPCLEWIKENAKKIVAKK